MVQLKCVWEGSLTCVQKLQVRSILEHRVVAASNKWSTFNYKHDLPTKSQASILATCVTQSGRCSTWSRKPDSGASP
jgi:hypothetical protein